MPSHAADIHRRVEELELRDPGLRRRIVELDEKDPDITVRQIAERLGTDLDTVRDVLVARLVETGGSRVPRLRRALNRQAARLNYL